MIIEGLIGMAIATSFLSLILGSFMAAEEPKLGLRFALGGLAVVS